MDQLINFSGVILASIITVIAVLFAWLNRGGRDFFIFACFSIAFIGILIREVVKCSG